ncbi:hypothetical protein [Streptomyces rochei]|uniref:hypothetical protein n=1 Tax=Streptomyces rochei TaxID=1928 RepID=UPI0036FAD6F3
MITLTLDKAKELLAEAVAEKGEDFVYVNRDGRPVAGLTGADCHYVHGDQPGCIVGHVLHKAGVSLADLSEYEGQGAEDPALDLAGATDDACRLLSYAQENQDRGIPWGESVRLALAYM